MTSSKPSQATCSADRGPVLPFLKWPGGKRWLAPHVAEIVRGALRGTYYEPFLGGGAVFFHLRPERAVLSDINGDLLNTYAVVHSHPKEVVEAVQAMPVSKMDYYRIREHEPENALERAARFLYLNRTAFGGIYRLNRYGKFNVPFGDRTPEALWRDRLIESAALALDATDLRVSDFEAVISTAGDGDVVYCDPTYTVAHSNNGFLRYNEKNFAWHDQQRLARAAGNARERGAMVIISNADHLSIRELYRGEEYLLVERPSNVSTDPSRRRSVAESLIILRPRGQRAPNNEAGSPGTDRVERSTSDGII